MRKKASIILGLNHRTMSHYDSHIHTPCACKCVCAIDRSIVCVWVCVCALQWKHKLSSVWFCIFFSATHIHTNEMSKGKTIPIVLCVTNTVLGGIFTIFKRPIITEFKDGITWFDTYFVKIKINFTANFKWNKENELIAIK